MIKRKYLLKPDWKDPRDFKFAKRGFIARLSKPLPPAVDLRHNCSPVVDQGQIGCHDDQTEVLTYEGWKLFENVSKEDLLATVNPETKELIYEKPIQLFKYPYCGEMICLENKTLNFKVTPNHNMVVRKWDESKRTLSDNYSFVRADNIGWYAGLINRIRWNGDGKSYEQFVLSGVEHKQKPQRIDRKIKMSSWLRFLGIYLAEGTILKPCRKGQYKIQIAGSKERERRFIRKTLNEIGVNFCELKDRFTFSNKQIYSSLTEMGLTGVRAPFKFIPSFVFEQTSENIKEFLLGHFMGDGCEQYGHRSHYTSSKLLADGLQRLIFLSGEYSGVFSREPRTAMMKDGRIVVGKYPEFRVSVCEIRNLSIERKESIFREFYEGFVYCAEVPTYHTLVTRRGGKILISGNSCTANAIASGLGEYLQITKTGTFTPLSRLFLYYQERAMEGTIDQDAGAQIRDGMQVFQQMGVCPETDDPYDVSKFTLAPSEQAVTDAAQHKISAYHRVTGIDGVQTALSQGSPVVTGIQVYESFESDMVASTGIVPAPESGEQGLGGHAVLIVGYDTPKQWFIVRNSWGANWGVQGYFYLPFSVFSKVVADMWTGV